MMNDQNSNVQMSQQCPFNLEAIKLYVYPDQYLLEPNIKIPNIKTNICINRKNLKIIQTNKSEKIPGSYEKKVNFSAFLGILLILNKSFLIFVEMCEKVCSIEGQDIFQIKEIGVVPIQSESQFEKETSDKANSIYNYLLYIKNYLLKEGYYFSFQYDLTLSRSAYSQGYPTKLKYAWNLHMGKNLLKLQDKGWFVPLIQGSIKSFKVFLQGTREVGKKIEYYLITRRSCKRGGTRYNARGIDSKGFVANFCETQQIIFINNYCFSHLQIRGSVPVFWKQTGIYAEVQFYRNHQSTKKNFLKHFERLSKLFNRIFCINLLSKEKTGELQLTLYFQQLVKDSNLNYSRYQFYDFHFATRGQKFQRSNYLIDKISGVNKFFKYYMENISQMKVISLQNGVMRTNCLDCLDRTNLIQSKIAYDVLTNILVKCGFDIKTFFGNESIVTAVDDPLASNQMIISLKNAWADNGDMISKHYTGTGSTHTNVTRTGKRDLKGIMDHGFKTLSRFYKQYMEDNFKQQVIDLIVGEHTQTMNLTQFESRLKDIKQQDLDAQFMEI